MPSFSWQDIVARCPLITPQGRDTLRHLFEHVDAPRWNHLAGDRVGADELQAAQDYAAQLAVAAPASAQPSPSLLAWLAERLPQVPLWRRRIAVDADLARHWHDLPTSSRDDLANQAAACVPDDADLQQMIVYRTAGTTGHALLVPHAVSAVACYPVLLQQALAAWGVAAPGADDQTVCFLVGAQARTVTYPCTLAAWGGGGFAKLNLQPGEWPEPAARQRYFAAHAPQVLTGDPIAFAQMLRDGIEVRPQAMITTAVAMSAALRSRLQQTYGCPVIDWYSLTETGPLGYACPASQGVHLLPHDVYVETLTADGRPTAPGERGEITVSGGRNPFFPLLRYRTGDWGVLAQGRCACGSERPRLLELEGRAPVLLKAVDGAWVNPVDVSRTLREFPLVQHELTQRRDGALELRVRTVHAADVAEAALRTALTGLFGSQPLQIIRDEQLGDRTGKVLPYRSEWLLEE